MSLQIAPTHPQADSYVDLTTANAYLANRTDLAEWNALTDDQKEQLLKRATRQIDTFRFFEAKMYRIPLDYRLEQKLEFPRNNHFSINNVVTSATSTKLVSTGLINLEMYPDDFWNYGAVVITSGTGKGQVRLVTDYVSSTGEITIDSAWTTTPDNTSQFRLIKKIPDEVRDATIEQAFFISKGGGKRAQLQAEGVKSYSIGDLSETFEGGGTNEVKLSNEAMSLLQGFISRIGSFIW